MTKKNPAEAGFLKYTVKEAYLRPSLKAFETLKVRVLEALILMLAPVAGLTPLRAARLTLLKDPKPTIVSPSAPLAEVRALIAEIVFSTARLASAAVSYAAGDFLFGGVVRKSIISCFPATAIVFSYEMDG